MNEESQAEDAFAAAGGRRRKFRDALRHLAVLARLARAVKAGEYDLATPHVAMLFGTLAYVVSPIDVVPEAFLGPLGIGDDASLLVATGAALAIEIAAFLEWEESQAA